jgi:hypothetical protein
MLLNVARFGPGQLLCEVHCKTVSNLRSPSRSGSSGILLTS